MNRLIHWLITHPVEGKSVRETSARHGEDDAVVRVDPGRMRAALDSRSYVVARDLSREEKRQQILAIARRQR